MPPPPPSLDHGVCDRSERSEEAGAEAEAEAGSMQKTSFPTEKGGLEREREGARISKGGEGVMCSSGGEGRKKFVLGAPTLCISDRWLSDL